jgi:hypothetical protein
MVGASKILTVSYGTFSCTLEGFDEPFSTMKAIAEYFRDLAADDRYFGAEPPTPDAAMLHRIAEREINRRVDAKVEDNGVVLRAAEQGAAAKAPSQPPRASLGSANPAPAAPAPKAALYEDLSDPTEEGRDRISESVAAKLSRIRSAVDGARTSGEKTRPPQNLAALLAASDDSEAADTAEADAKAKQEAEAAKAKAKAEADAKAKAEADAKAKQEAEAAKAKAEADAKAKQEAEAAKAKAEADAKAKQEAEAAKAKADADAKAKQEAEAAKAKAEADAKAKQEADAAKAKAEADAKAKQEADAAKAKAEAEAKAKQDAEAAKAKAEAEAKAKQDAEEAEAAVDDASFDVPEALVSTPEVTTSAATDDDDRLIASLTGRFADEDTAPSARFDDDLEDEAAATTALSDDDRLMAALAETLSKSAPKADVKADETLPDGPALEGETAKGKGADRQKVQTAADDFDDEEEDLDLPALDDAEGAEAQDQKAPKKTAKPDTAPQPAKQAPKPTAPPSEGLAPESLAKVERARARVIKIKRAEPKPSATPKPASHQGTATLSAEAEADLMRELEDVRADATAPGKTAEPAKAPETAKAAPRRDAITGAEESASVSRLIQQTNLELQGPENRRRLQAISHLKAAVAATEAERKTKGNDAKDSEEQRMTPYRSDLERVVRPGKSSVSVPARQGDRPPPLVLVSEQRIDRPKTATAPPAAPTQPAQKPAATVTPIRPRRVASGNLAVSAAQDADDIDDDDDDDAVSEAQNIFDSPIRFADLVAQIGATEFPDLLEAAVAYAHCVEGKESVARPAIMRRLLDHLSDSEDGRETILRNLGALLRSGRLKKVDRTTFALDPTSPVLAEAKAMVARSQASTEA